MGEQIGAKSIDLEGVQVHPTGLVKPDDPDAKIKFLTAEALRGVGDLAFNKDGELFSTNLAAATMSLAKCGRTRHFSVSA